MRRQVPVSIAERSVFISPSSKRRQIYLARITIAIILRDRLPAAHRLCYVVYDLRPSFVFFVYVARGDKRPHELRQRSVPFIETFQHIFAAHSPMTPKPKMKLDYFINVGVHTI